MDRKEKIETICRLILEVIKEHTPYPDMNFEPEGIFKVYATMDEIKTALTDAIIADVMSRPSPMGVKPYIEIMEKIKKGEPIE